MGKKKTQVTDLIEQIRGHKWPWVGYGSKYDLYKITDGYRISPRGNLTKGNDLEGDRLDIGETN